MKKQRFVFLSQDFYNTYNSQEYPEIEHKPLRPYIQVLLEINGIQFAIPLRSNIRHPHALWTDKKNHCGLDFSKAVVIEKEEYIDKSKAPHIRQNEFDALRGKDYQIYKKMLSYIKEYKRAKENLDDRVKNSLYQKSTLKYFEHYLDKIPENNH